MKKSFYLMSTVVMAALLIAGCAEGKGNPEEVSGMNQHASHSDQAKAGTNHNGHDEAKTHADIKTSWSLSDKTAQSNKDEKLTISIEKSDGTPVEDFDINHEKKMHLIVVSKDLSFFNHIHPAFEGKGVFTINTKFPAGGDYKLFADYIPKGGTGVTAGKWVKVSGAQAKQQPIEPESNMTKVVDGKEVTLSFDGDLKAGKEVMMTFNIKDASTKQPITTLQPYLGAVGHVVILSEDAEKYLHVHPSDESAKGPDAMFHTKFPNPGIYKIWGQFQHEGKVFTVPFVVSVQ